jgi:hypothetical protein
LVALPTRLGGCGESGADSKSRREPCLRKGKLSAMASRGRLAFGLTVGAVAWGLVLVAAAFLVPVYGGSSISSTGVVKSTIATLVGVNGVWVIAPMAVPVVLALLGWFGLHRKCSRGAKAGGYLAWGCVTVLGAFSVVAAASIGLFSVPAVLLLAAAAKLTPTALGTTSASVACGAGR